VSPIDLPQAARKVRDFDELLTTAQIDAVILGGQFNERSSRLRRLIQLGRHCICLHPADTSPLFYHEVALIAADRGVVLVPWLPIRLHPACQAFIAACRPESLGAMKFVTIERTGPLPTGRLLMAGTYAEAIEMLVLLGADVTEVSTTGDATVGRLAVHHRLSRGSACEVRLQRTTAASDSWRIAVEGECGYAELILDEGLAGSATLHRTDQHGPHETAYPAPELASLVLAEFRSAVSGQAHGLRWSDAIRAIELADWAWYSLERRRAIDVFHEERGELASFKGRMTSLGCGLIWMTLFVLIVIAAGTGLHLPGMDWLAGATAVVWLLFLLFQALRWTLPAHGESDQSSGSSSASALR
jgi:predicted dehydrogenase